MASPTDCTLRVSNSVFVTTEIACGVSISAVAVLVAVRDVLATLGIPVQVLSLDDNGFEHHHTFLSLRL